MKTLLAFFTVLISILMVSKVTAKLLIPQHPPIMAVAPTLLLFFSLLKVFIHSMLDSVTSRPVPCSFWVKRAVCSVDMCLQLYLLNIHLCVHLGDVMVPALRGLVTGDW